MHRSSFSWPARLFAAPLAVSLIVAAAHPQSLPTNRSAPPGRSAPPSQPVKPNPGDAKPNPDDAWLASTGKLYYSATKAGLAGFDCAVHPDWYALFVSANKGSTVAKDDARIRLLQTVSITLHVRMKGGSTLDWRRTSGPDRSLDQKSSALLANMYQATDQTLQGFLQFWTPFVNGSLVPDSSAGLTITRSATGYTIHAEQGGTALTELFDSRLLLRQFDIVIGKNTSIEFLPAFKPTRQGLLVSGFTAQVLPLGAPPVLAREMRVAIAYQSRAGFLIPARLNMEVPGTGVFNFVFDGCKVMRELK